MAKEQETAGQIAQWLAEEWGKSLASSIESMAGERPTTSCDGILQPCQSTEGSLTCEQEFSPGANCRIRISVPELVWREVGTRVLRAAGIEEVGPEDAIGTFKEVLGQAFSGLAQAIGARTRGEVTCGTRENKDGPFEQATGLSVIIGLPETEIGNHPVFLFPAPELVEYIRSPNAASEPVAPSLRSLEASEQPSSSMSKTFDLLLDVHLPVSVSFGRTSMVVKEVLKLTTGSIVELNRAVTEPVDIIVNNCIIARGDVVVVGGNYGVRVREIVSREQRYQTGVRPVAPPLR